MFQSVIQLDHSSYSIPGENESLKVFTFMETITSMPGAVIVPDLSVNQIVVRALKQLIAVKMVSLNQFFNAMVIHVFLVFKSKLVEIFHSLLRSVHLTVVKVKVPLGGLTRLSMVRSETFALDLQITSDFTQIKWKVL